jgi:hypothetical protein
LAYQPPASSNFLSEQISHQQSASSTFLSEQISTSHQPPAKRTGCKMAMANEGRSNSALASNINKLRDQIKQHSIYPNAQSSLI